MQVNLFRREVHCKIVYYGPGASGKTTNLEMVHKRTPATHRGELTSIATEHDRTLFFDFMPIDLGTVGGLRTKLRLFTVPGQSFYNSTRKLVLQGTDGIIFVADSQRYKLQENIESLRNLEENLKIHTLDIRQIPLVIQWNKRDMPTAMPIAELEREINFLHSPTFEAVASNGEGVFPTLKKCAALVLDAVNKQEQELSGKTAPMPERIEVGDINNSGIKPILSKKITAVVSKATNIGVPVGISSEPGQAPAFKKFQRLIDNPTLENK